jgi:hypothetical protein
LAGRAGWVIGRGRIVVVVEPLPVLLVVRTARLAYTLLQPLLRYWR